MGNKQNKRHHRNGHRHIFYRKKNIYCIANLFTYFCSKKVQQTSEGDQQQRSYSDLQLRNDGDLQHTSDSDPQQRSDGGLPHLNDGDLQQRNDSDL